MTTVNKPNILYWIIAIILGLLWNAYGVYLFIIDTFTDNEAMMSAYTEAQRTMIESVPSWLAVVYGIATIGALLASIGMLMRKKWCVPLFGISLLAILLNFIYMWIALDSGEIMGLMMGYIMPLIVILIGLILYLYSKYALKKGWLH